MAPGGRVLVAAMLLALALPPSALAATAKACPDGSAPVNCEINPCAYTTCMVNTVCEANYCGGCNAVCKPLASPKPKPASSPRPATTQTVCPIGKPQVACIVDPCSTRKCSSGYKCVSNYCGGCNSKCVRDPAQMVTSPRPSTAPLRGQVTYGSICPPGKPLVNCFVNPCDVKDCGGLKCVSNYCGGCNAYCIPGVKQVVSAMSVPKASVCKPVKCKENPCALIRCRDGYTCKTNYCAGPNACTGGCVANKA